MQKSESIAAISVAMKEIQSKLPAVGKDSKGYGYEYASLPEVCNKIYPLATEAGLSVSQVLDESISGGPAITTLLMHESGEWICGTYPLAEAGMKGVNSAQQFGAAITYARRYGLLAVFGVPVADDDAACLSERPKGEEKKPKDGKKKILDMIGSSGDMGQVKTLCGQYKQQAQEEGWIEELNTWYRMREEELG